MAATAAEFAEFAKTLAASCKPGEAAVIMVYVQDGVSCCVSSSETAHRVAAETAAGTDPVTDDTLLAVAVVSPDGTLTEYPVAS